MNDLTNALVEELESIWGEVKDVDPAELDLAKQSRATLRSWVLLRCSAARHRPSSRSSRRPKISSRRSAAKRRSG
jgi:hypothetical protein